MLTPHAYPKREVPKAPKSLFWEHPPPFRGLSHGLLMHAFVSTIYFSSLVFFLVFLSFLSNVFVYAFVFYFFSFLSISPLFSFLPPFLLFMATSLYTICHCVIYPFCPLTIFGSLWASLQDCPPAYWLSSHYLCSECLVCTTLHFQTKLLVLFLTSLRSYFTHMDKD